MPVDGGSTKRDRAQSRGRRSNAGSMAKNRAHASSSSDGTEASAARAASADRADRLRVMVAPVERWTLWEKTLTAESTGEDCKAFTTERHREHGEEGAGSRPKRTWDQGSRRRSGAVTVASHPCFLSSPWLCVSRRSAISAFAAVHFLCPPQTPPAAAGSRGSLGRDIGTSPVGRVRRVCRGSHVPTPRAAAPAPAFVAAIVPRHTSTSVSGRIEPPQRGV